MRISHRATIPVNRRDHSYRLPADVYSFGMMQWEIAVCHKPFKKSVTVEQHSDLVVSKGYRPKLAAIPGSRNLKMLIQSCWDVPESRSAFTYGRKVTSVGQ